MIAHILSWLRGGSRSAPVHAHASARVVSTRDAAEIPAGGILLTGGVDYGFEVVGQANHQGALEVIHRDHAAGGDECRVIAALVPDGQNDYDASAIGVSICGLTVAHFSREDGKKYRKVMADVSSQGLAVCRASIRATRSASADARGSYRISLDLAAPEKAAPRRAW